MICDRIKAYTYHGGNFTLTRFRYHLSLPHRRHQAGVLGCLLSLASVLSGAPQDDSIPQGRLDHYTTFKVIVPYLEARLGDTLVLMTNIVAEPALGVIDRAALASENCRKRLHLAVSPHQGTDLAGALPTLLDTADDHPVVRQLGSVRATNGSTPMPRWWWRRDYADKIFRLELQKLILEDAVPLTTLHCHHPRDPCRLFVQAVVIGH